MPNKREKQIELLEASLRHECDFGGEVTINMGAEKTPVGCYLSPTEPLTNCQQWIPVTERLPEHFGGYIVTVQDAFGKRYSDYADYDPYELYWRTGLNRGTDEYVTHWMPLPEPPKGE